MRSRLLLGTWLNKLFVLILKATEWLIFDTTNKNLSYQKNVFFFQGFGKKSLWYQERVGRGDLRIVATSKIDGKGSEWFCLFSKNQETKNPKTQTILSRHRKGEKQKHHQKKMVLLGLMHEPERPQAAFAGPPWLRRVCVFWEHISRPHLGTNKKNIFPNQHKHCLQCFHPELDVPL